MTHQWWKWVWDPEPIRECPLLLLYGRGLWNVCVDTFTLTWHSISNRHNLSYEEVLTDPVEIPHRPSVRDPLIRLKFSSVMTTSLNLDGVLLLCVPRVFRKRRSSENRILYGKFLCSRKKNFKVERPKYSGINWDGSPTTVHGGPDVLPSGPTGIPPDRRPTDLDSFIKVRCLLYRKITWDLTPSMNPVWYENSSQDPVFKGRDTYE